jgi:hypothetical protein
MNKNVQLVLKEEEVPIGTSWKMYEGTVFSVMKEVRKRC